MTVTVSPSQAAVQATFRLLLLSVLPAGVEVVEGQDNRVPEPESPDFVVMTVLSGYRLSTNLDEEVDAVFVGSIAGGVLTATSLLSGVIQVGASVFGRVGSAVAPGSQITGLISGSGGPGTYSVSPSQSIPSQTLAASATAIQESTEVEFQLDVHSPVVARAADMARAISASFRDDYAVQFFADNGMPLAAPLHADDPRQMPFVNEEKQYETRWVVGARLQVNYVVSGFPQQYAGSLQIVTTEVEAAFPLP